MRTFPAMKLHDEFLRKANKVFSKVQRPEHFTDYQHCCECAEHDDTLSAHTPDTITREALGHAGWDPVTFATDSGFRYYLPALMRMALTRTGDDYYIDQFLSQVIRDGPRNSRWRACTAEQRTVVRDALLLLLEQRLDEIEENYDADRLMQAIDIWSDDGESSPGS